MLKELIEKLIDHQDLSLQESEAAIHEMLKQANPHQIAAFLVLMRAKRETVEELVGIMNAMEHFMVAVPTCVPVLDIVGTGGDKAHTVNISTGASILAASMGVKIAKHGNRSVSSLSGSADVLEAFGIPCDLPAEHIIRSIDEIGIGFMYAPHFHPALQTLKTIRKDLSVRTAFNIVAPLLNPARAEHQMIGVFHPELIDVIALALFQRGTKRSFIFHGQGIDELSCLGPAKVTEVTQQGLTHFILDPQEFGLPLCSLDALKGGKAEENAQKLLRVFEGEENPLANTLAFNAGVAAYLYGICENIQEGILKAKTHLKEGKAFYLLDKWRTLCQST